MFMYMLYFCVQTKSYIPDIYVKNTMIIYVFKDKTP